MGLLHRQAPVVGEEGCTHLDGTGYFTVPLEDDDLLVDGFSVLIDLQADEPVEQIVFGNRENDGTVVLLTANADGHTGRFRIELGDDQGRLFVAAAETSRSAGKRILCRVVPETNELLIAEIQPWASDESADVRIERADGPSIARALASPFVVGGIGEAGKARGTFAGRLANFAVFPRPLDPHRVSDFRQASVERLPSDLPSGSPEPLMAEGRSLFLDDYQRLLHLITQGSLSGTDTRDVSVLAFRWLCDRRPLLQRLADHYGAQLSLPDLNPMREYREAVTEDKPIFYFSYDRWEGNWLPPSAFLDDATFWLGNAQRDVSWAAFIRFVRNKLGGGHFDPDDRKRWQEELHALATETSVAEEEWLNVKMLALARGLCFAVESCGFVSRAKFGL